MQTHKTLQRIVDVKYEVIGTAKKLHMIQEAYPLMKLTGHVAQEFVGKPKDGRTPVTLRLLIDETEFETVKNASFKVRSIMHY
jgi:hypothetical protein